MSNAKSTIDVVCDGKALPRGERMERPWHCTACGAKFHGYDSTVMREFKEHKVKKHGIQPRTRRKK